MTRPTFRCIVATALLATLLPLGAHAAAPTVADDLQMASASQPFRQAADLFVARAAAGDVAGTQAMLSRHLVDRSGEAAIRRALENQIVPFFRQGRAPGRSVTITQTTDAAGQRGFAFYMWMEQAEGAARKPFTVYVVQEQERLVVANIVPERLVEGRHR
jgi:excinuclease UvrABC nuclease subunit